MFRPATPSALSVRFDTMPAWPRQSGTPALPAGYAEVLAELKAQVRDARVRAQRVVNTELLSLY